MKPYLNRRRIDCSSVTYRLIDCCSRCTELGFERHENSYDSESEKTDHIRRHLMVDRDAICETVKDAKQHRDFDFLYRDCFLKEISERNTAKLENQEQKKLRRICEYAKPGGRVRKRRKISLKIQKKLLFSAGNPESIKKWKTPARIFFGFLGIKT